MCGRIQETKIPTTEMMKNYGANVDNIEVSRIKGVKTKERVCGSFKGQKVLLKMLEKRKEKASPIISKTSFTRGTLSISINKLINFRAS